MNERFNLYQRTLLKSCNFWGEKWLCMALKKIVTGGSSLQERVWHPAVHDFLAATSHVFAEYWLCHQTCDLVNKFPCVICTTCILKKENLCHANTFLDIDPSPLHPPFVRNYQSMSLSSCTSQIIWNNLV